MQRLAVIAILAFAPVAFAVTPSSPRGISGYYNSNWDDISLIQEGNYVRGTYVCCGGGRVEGVISDGKTIHYTWRQPSATGMGVWTIRDGRLEGTWGNGQSETDGGRWDLTIAKPKSQIAN